MDKTLELNFLLNYPAVVPSIDDPNVYKGYIFVQDSAYPVNLRRTGDTYRLEMCTELRPYSERIESVLHKKAYVHPVQFLDDLRDVLSVQNQPEPTKIRTQVWRAVLREYFEFRNFHIGVSAAELSPDLSGVRVEYVDFEKRPHKLVVRVNCDEPANLFEAVDYDLPGDVRFQADASLQRLYEKFLLAVDKYQEFFDLMDRIDGECWVLDPSEPRRSDTYRRIALDDKVSMVVTFDPNNLSQMPSVKFLGPQNRTAVLSERRDTNFVNWESTEDVLSELLKLIELPAFPSKVSRESDKELLLFETGECCICFSSRLDDKLPDVICPNPSCSQFFHTSCLFQWLCSVNSKKFFFEIYGQCPNCEKAIHCCVPDKSD